MTSTIANSRGRRRPTYHLLTPPNRYPSRLAGWESTTVFKLATPRTSTARFGQYLLELEPGGGSGEGADGSYEHFLLVMSGVTVLNESRFPAGSYAYLPAGAGLTLRTEALARVMWIKRPYEPAPGFEPPAAVHGRVEDLASVTTPSGVLRRELLPTEDPAFDFAISLMTFPPGADLGMVEIHDEEHGLYMTQGAGTYHLDGDDLEVAEGDFIYMAPYCPQYFRPHGPGDAQYLLYKDVLRDGF
jgi:(S)-ureidoglycine aminohydrolase